MNNLPMQDVLTADKLVVRANLHLFANERGGRKRPITSGYRPSWNLGNTWFDGPTINDGRVLLDIAAELEPGTEGHISIEPLAPEFWGRVDVGSVLPMQEGTRVVGHATVLGVDRPELLRREVAAFVVEARQLCDFVVRAGEFTLPDRLWWARRLLLRLLDAGGALPRIDAVTDVDAGASPNGPTGWPGFERFDEYWEVFDPYVGNAPVVGSLSDDVLDVWRDLHRGLALWDRQERRSAVWEWRFHFDHHWGDHATDAVRALHRACAGA